MGVYFSIEGSAVDLSNPIFLSLIFDRSYGDNLTVANIFLKDELGLGVVFYSGI